MNTIDTRLEQAAEDAATMKTRAPAQPVSSVRRSLRRRTRFLTATSLFLVLGIAGSFAVGVAQDGTNPPTLLAMSDNGESAVAVGTFPHLVIDQPGWVVTDVEETASTADYTYRGGDKVMTLHIEFGDEAGLNRLLSDRTAGATVVMLTDQVGMEASECAAGVQEEVVDKADECGVGDWQVALVEHDGAGWIAIWGASGRIYELTPPATLTEADVLDILGSLTVADEAQWLDTTGT